MKKKIFLPNLCTTLSLSCGLFVIFKMNMIAPGHATYNQALGASCILMLAAFLDLFDGAIARAMGGESAFGGFFDSMSDAIVFGVAPATVILKTVSLTPAHPAFLLLSFGALSYTIASILRLVRFTVKKNDTAAPGTHSFFTGLPVPASAACLLSISLVFLSEEVAPFTTLNSSMHITTVTVSFFLLAFFMLSKLKFPSLKNLELKTNSFLALLILCFTAAFFLFEASQYFPLVFAGAMWLYILIACFFSLFYRREE